MPEHPSHGQRNSATFAALMMVLTVAGGLLGLVAFVLPQVLWIILVAAAIAVSILLQYLVWGRWLTQALREEDERNQLARAPSPDLDLTEQHP